MWNKRGPRVEVHPTAFGVVRTPPNQPRDQKEFLVERQIETRQNWRSIFRLGRAAQGIANILDGTLRMQASFHLGNVLLSVDTPSVEVKIGRVVVMESFESFSGKDFWGIDNKDFRM